MSWKAVPRLLHFAQWWAQHGPRAKSWLPRKIGRFFGRNWQAVLTTPDGLELAVDPSNLDVFTEILRRGNHEPHVVRACIDLMRDGHVFYDVGASAGYFALSVARSFASGAVFAFEPQTSMATSLARSAQLNRLSNIVVVPAMVGAFDGSRRLFLPGHSVHASAARPGPQTRAVMSPIRTLDSLVKTGAVPVPNVIKIDVEGGERDVILGAEAVIREHQPSLVFEALTELTQRFGYRREELFELLSSYADFRFKGIRDDGTLVDLPDSLDDPSIRDFVAIPVARISTRDDPHC